jgi:hypothetical protein
MDFGERRALPGFRFAPSRVVVRGPPMKDAILFLVKFFPAKRNEYAEQFIRGKLFMNRLSYFQNVELAQERADRYEATAIWWQPNNLSIQFKDHPELNIGPQDLGAPVSITFDHHGDLHIFCMSAMHTGEFEYVDGKFECRTDDDAHRLREQLAFSERCLKLGDVAVVVNAGEFMLRVKRAIDKKRFKFASTLVEYYDPTTYHGKFRYEEIPFRKRIEFTHEREYRIVIDSKTKGEDALELEIGDISDISAKMAAKNLNNEFRIALNK